MSRTPIICIFGADLKLTSEKHVPKIETNELDCRCYKNDDDLWKILARDRPHTIVTIGKPEDYPKLLNAPYSVRRKWINYKDTEDIQKIGTGAFRCFLGALEERKNVPPVVSIFTPAYKSGKRIKRPLKSLKKQTYTDWEWVIMDDSDDDGETYEYISNLTRDDHRIRVYRHQHSGRIGEVKLEACMLCRGDYLVELDHDDELTPDALYWITKGFEKYPEGGFLYTNFADFHDNWTPMKFTAKSWAFGYGSYKSEHRDGRLYHIAQSPRINSKTIRHIVAAPNHVRVWRRKTYLEIGGHNPAIHVADDYELVVRTFLHTRMIHVPKLCYLQFYYPNTAKNTQRLWNKEIQRLVRHFAHHYSRQIHDRFVDLGVDDFIWRDGRVDWGISNPEMEPHATLIFPVSN